MTTFAERSERAARDDGLQIEGRIARRGSGLRPVHLAEVLASTV
jgi:hypothetical protein